MSRLPSLLLSARWILSLALVAMHVDAGYIGLNMTSPVQCGRSTVRWTGDGGPYHLLLTPTDFVLHGYNVWIDSIPDGTNSYDLPIRLPAGLQFMLTIWGASGISYAGTTDVMTVRPSAVPDTTCFLSEQEILNLYSFSFNLTNSGGDSPPQCSNLSIAWPTSLESNVTSDVTARGSADLHPRSELTTELEAEFEDDGEDDTLLPSTMIELDERDASSSSHDGNTTNPPTMFGIIPLGNSFSIPITYSRRSRYAKYLPESSLSDNPTTRTRQGTTYLNWTLDMAKGTRFILVAGIGSQQKWASGGSSKMFTVGQGTTGCTGGEQGGNSAAPSITASSSAEGPTSPVNDDNPSPQPQGSPVTRTVVASVLSVVGTLVIVGVFFVCRRRARRRRLENGVTAFRGKPKAAEQMTLSSDTPLDLIQSRDGSRAGGGLPRLSPLVLGANGPLTAVSPIDPFSDHHGQQASATGPNFTAGGPTRSTTMDQDSPAWSPTSPMRDPGMPSRDTSLDALLSHGAYPQPRSPTQLQSNTFTSNGSGSGTYNSRGPLTLHDSGTFATDAAEEDVSDLKRATIAFLGNRAQTGGPSTTRSNDATRTPTPAPPTRRRRNQPSEDQREVELEYMVHRDAGRIAPEEAQNVLELPPRYDEVDWEEQDRLDRGADRQT